MQLIPVKDFPIGFFAMTMAFFGLALAWRLSELSTFISVFLSIIAVLLFIMVSVGYVIKFIKHREIVISEFKHPIMMSFFGTITVSIVFLGVIIAPQFYFLSILLWGIGTTFHSILVVYTLGQWLFHKTMDIEHITPACFIPIVGLVVVPVYGATHGFITLSWFFWSIGFLLWIILLVFVFYRLMFVSSLPAPLRPLMFILLAPPSVIFIDYVNLTGKSLDIFSNAMYSFALLVAVLLLSQIRQFKIPFTMSYWAFTFPVIAFSIATMLMGEVTRNSTVQNLGYLVLLAASVLVCVVFMLTVKNVMLIKK